MLDRVYSAMEDMLGRSFFQEIRSIKLYAGLVGIDRHFEPFALNHSAEPDLFAEEGLEKRR